LDSKKKDHISSFADISDKVDQDSEIETNKKMDIDEKKKETKYSKDKRPKH